MKKIVLLIAISTVFFACKKEVKNKAENNITENKKAISKYPDALDAIFNAHGGIDNWQKMKTLSFGLNKEEHTTDLHSRKTVINSADYSLGFDGKDVWVSDTTAYKKDPKFYYNLYFYFYAMPYVLADDGIIYSETTSLEFEGKKYPGIKISYKSNVGSSSDDNYYMYYDAVTKKMSWLGYTVTYFSKTASDKIKLIRYNDWEKVNGFLLPKSLTWYQKDTKGNPTKPDGKPIEFLLPLLSEKSLGVSFYQKPAK
ncbi:hypothetical protein PG913_03825 [Tenacibaculum pacificus]|uniref:DUF6503 family protein n=1 Tax=Tenacibaculum pacificus TaxID=3018314 RepID=UPI0022F3E657|nr:DUF6503 family protein [Tenacibaculum pacificus]WBX74341.1 hypothetical protein PG913_03825 [Tenacibaculum pacificus]